MIVEMLNTSTLVWLVAGILLLVVEFPSFVMLSVGAFAAALCSWLGYGIIKQLIAACVAPVIFMTLIFVVAGVMNGCSRSRPDQRQLLEKSCKTDCSKENHHDTRGKS